jgi:hypothetical protein
MHSSLILGINLKREQKQSNDLIIQQQVLGKQMSSIVKKKYYAKANKYDVI